MKKNDRILITATALYSFLFYKEAAGINFFIFSAALIALVLLRDLSLARNRKWLIAAAGTLISGAAVAIYGNWLSLWANIISLGLLAGFSISARSSVIVALFHSLYSVASSMVFMVLDAIERKPAQQGQKRSPFYVRLLLVLIPLLITLIFFFLYRGSNPIFNSFAKNIRFDFITWGWVFFTLLGFILLYGFFYHKRIKGLASWDENAPAQLSSRVVEEDGAGGLFSIRNQYLSGVLLFAMLNILLLVVNALDLQYVYITQTLPPGLTHSENVHQGVELLILSIVIAIAIILFVFRGDMNFYSKNRMLRVLAYAWIIQNMFMIVSTMMRNNIYIGEHGLTYKRIGVYVYLSLALIGLITTWVKIMKIKSNWFLFRVNTGVWYVLLVIASLISWDKIIADHNIRNARNLQALDKGYLIELAPSTLPEMLSYNDSTDFLRKEYSEPEYGFTFFPDLDADYNRRTLESKLHGRLYEFFEDRQELGWPSWNYDDSRIRSEVIRLSNEGRLKHLSLAMFDLHSLKPLEPVSSNVISLDLASNRLGQKLDGLAAFLNVQELNLSSNAIDSLAEFPLLSKLKELDLSLNQPLRSVAGLRNAPGLSVLKLASCTHIDVRELPVLKELKELDLSGTTVANPSQLVKFKKLEDLKLHNSTLTMYSKEMFPSLPSLRKLDVSYHYDQNYSEGVPASAAALLRGIAKCTNLEELNLSSNNLFLLDPLLDASSEAALPNLKMLNLQGNRISDLQQAVKFMKLRSLNISNNAVQSLEPLAALADLKELRASNNNIKSTTALRQLMQLESLVLANVTNLSSDDLGPLVNLRFLDISGTNVSSVKALRGMKKLEYLYIQNNQVESLEGIHELASLKVLDISGNRIEDLTPLYKLHQLGELYIDAVPDSKMNALQKALPGVKIIITPGTARR